MFRQANICLAIFHEPWKNNWFAKQFCYSLLLETILTINLNNKRNTKVCCFISVKTVFFCTDPDKHESRYKSLFFPAMYEQGEKSRRMKYRSTYGKSTVLLIRDLNSSLSMTSKAGLIQRILILRTRMNIQIY